MRITSLLNNFFKILQESKHFLVNFGFNHDIQKLSFGQKLHKMELHFKPTNNMFEDEFSSVHPNIRRHLFIDFQGLYSTNKEFSFICTQWLSICVIYGFKL